MKTKKKVKKVKKVKKGGLFNIENEPIMDKKIIKKLKIKDIANSMKSQNRPRVISRGGSLRRPPGLLENNIQKKKEKECAICFEEIKKTENNSSKILKCHGKNFHLECLNIWLENENKTCPICRSDKIIHKCEDKDMSKLSGTLVGLATGCICLPVSITWLHTCPTAIQLAPPCICMSCGFMSDLLQNWEDLPNASNF